MIYQIAMILTLLKPRKLVGTAKGQVVTTNDLFSVTL